MRPNGVRLIVLDMKLRLRDFTPPSHPRAEGRRRSAQAGYASVLKKPHARLLRQHVNALR